MTDNFPASHEQRRPGVLGVHSLDHFSVTVPDLAEASKFYEAFGLDVRPEGNALALYAFGHPHRWGLLQEGKRKKFGNLSFGIFEDDLPGFQTRLGQLNIQRISPPPGSESNGIWFNDPDGNVIELAVNKKSSPTEKSHFHAESVPAGVAGMMVRSRAPVTRPRRLSHVAVFSRDVDRSIKFYTDVLGMRLSDRSREFVAFMHGPHGSEHHMVAILKSGGAGFHHCSWDVGSVNDIGLGAMQMAKKGYQAGWGMGRHVLGSNYFHYVRDPWGSYSEYSADMDYIPPEIDWQAADHDPEDSMSLWGPVPPADFVTNFEIVG
jgi:catechol 2,3-dioxygenase-like lactoylglutathione lyase family enzyme